MQQDVRPEIRTVLVYALVDEDDVVGARLAHDQGAEFGVLYDDVRAPIVDSVTSDETGFFEISLPPGQYSLVLRAGDALFWPNGALDAQRVNPTEISEGERLEVKIDIQSLLPL